MKQTPVLGATYPERIFVAEGVPLEPRTATVLYVDVLMHDYVDPFVVYQVTWDHRLRTCSYEQFFRRFVDQPSRT